MFIKWLVSGDRRRYIDDEYDLDLSYITERIIAMSYPASGWSSMYRNSLADVKRFLEDKHKDSYLVFNLVEEEEGQYDPREFGHRNNPDGAVCIPFENHSVPTLLQMAELSHRAITWLDKDSRNVVVVHCMAGKGRTGLMLSALLIITEKVSSEEALALFAEKRSLERSGVTVPMQRHYVSTFAKVVDQVSGEGDTSRDRISKTLESLTSSKASKKLLLRAITLSESFVNRVKSIKIQCRNGNMNKFPANHLSMLTSGFLFENDIVIDSDFCVQVKSRDGWIAISWFCVDSPEYAGQSEFTIDNENAAIQFVKGRGQPLKISVRLDTKIS